MFIPKMSTEIFRGPEMDIAGGKRSLETQTKPQNTFVLIDRSFCATVLRLVHCSKEIVKRLQNPIVSFWKPEAYMLHAHLVLKKEHNEGVSLI